MELLEKKSSGAKRARDVVGYVSQRSLKRINRVRRESDESVLSRVSFHEEFYKFDKGEKDRYMRSLLRGRDNNDQKMALDNDAYRRQVQRRSSVLQAKIAQRSLKRNELFEAYNGVKKKKVTDYIITVVTDEEVVKGLLKQVRFLKTIFRFLIKLMCNETNRMNIALC